MRMEELEDNRYQKSPDEVEKYILGIIRSFLSESKEGLEGSKEKIINEAVERLKTEMNYNALGVMSVTLPDGEVRKGNVTITLEDLGGEPEITDKHNAFNVDFGDKTNTACEGNDPRLSDARNPLPHKHEMSDIKDLDGILSTIQGKIDRTNVYMHKHDNKDVLDKLRYSGQKDVIDLTILDNISSEIDETIAKLKKDIDDYNTKTQEIIESITTDITDLYEQLTNFKSYVKKENDKYLGEAQQYTDTMIADVVNDAKAYADANFVKKADVQQLIDLAKNCYILVTTETWNISNLINSATSTNREVVIPMSQNILDSISDANMNIGDGNIEFEFLLRYTDNNNTERQIPLPFINNDITSKYMYPDEPVITLNKLISNIKTTNDAIHIMFMTDNPSAYGYNNPSIELRIFAKSDVTITT